MEHTLPALATEPTTLPDGTELTARQANAALLKATTSMTVELIAEHAGYASRAAAQAYLTSDRGKRAVEAAVRTHLLEGATVALQTMIALARNAKSENVKQMAAADLMDRAGLRLEAKPDMGTGNREVNININLNTEDGQAKVIQHAEVIPAELAQPSEHGGGPGEKRRRGVGGDPSPTDKIQLK